MSLWVDLYQFDDSDQFGDIDLSDGAKYLVRRDTMPLKRWVFGDETFLQFQSRQYLHVAVSLVSRYVWDTYGAHASLVDAVDYEHKHKFTVSFIDGR